MGVLGLPGWSDAQDVAEFRCHEVVFFQSVQVLADGGPEGVEAFDVALHGDEFLPGGLIQFFHNAREGTGLSRQLQGDEILPGWFVEFLLACGKVTGAFCQLLQLGDGCTH